MLIHTDKIRWLWVAAFLFFILTLGAVYFKIRTAPDTIALRYNVIVGVNEIGNRYELLKIPLTGLLIGIVNFVLARLQKFDSVFLPFLASFITTVVNLLLFIAVLFLFRVS